MNTRDFLKLEDAYKTKYGADWFDCLTDAIENKQLDKRAITTTVLLRFLRLAAEPHS